MFGFIGAFIKGAIGFVKLVGSKIISLGAKLIGSKAAIVTAAKDTGAVLSCATTALLLKKTISNELKLRKPKAIEAGKGKSSKTTINSNGKVVKQGELSKRCHASIPLAAELENFSEIYENCTPEERKELKDINAKARESGKPEVPAQKEAITKLDSSKTVAQNMLSELEAYKRLRNRLDEVANPSNRHNYVGGVAEAYGMSADEYYNLIIVPTQKFRIDVYRKLAKKITTTKTYQKPAKAIAKKWNQMAMKLHETFDAEVDHKVKTLLETTRVRGGNSAPPLEFGGICG